MPDTASPLEIARTAYAVRDWSRAHAAFQRAASQHILVTGDLAHFATTAWMVGDGAGFTSTMVSVHKAHIEAGAIQPAVRAAFWVGLNLAQHGETAQAGGWFGRAGRLLEEADAECVERGYLLIPRILQAQGAGEWRTMGEVAAGAASIGRAFGDPDLVTLAIHARGLAGIKGGRLADGFALLDEAMLAVMTDELSPIVSGIVYCSVIEGCRDVFALRRAREWTDALARWCDGQDGLVAFNGECRMYRADILRLAGAWDDAIHEAGRAQARFATAGRAFLVAQARYQEGEIQRVRGEFDAAEACFTEASRGGHEPQPGLALLRLAQGQPDVAYAAIRRALGETTKPLARAPLLPALVEIALTAGERDAARGAAEELATLAETHATDLVRALAAQAMGAIHLAEGDAWAALVALRDAGRRWRALEAPYEDARTRELVGRACAAVGDADTARLELEAAREAFERLGAAVDGKRAANTLAEGVGGTPPSGAEEAVITHAARGGLTDREIEVLRLVAAGQPNKAIAAALTISEHTVARHLQNIYGKLGVSSRTEAGAYAHTHGLA